MLVLKDCQWDAHRTKEMVKVLDLVISQQPDQNMSKSLLEYDSYIQDQWIPAVLTFALVGTSAMAESSFANSNMTIIQDTDGNLKF